MLGVIEHLDQLEKALSYEAVCELMEIFDKQYLEADTLLKTFLDSRQTQPATDLAHKMKASAFNVGAAELGELYAKIEKEPQLYLSRATLEKVSQLYAAYKKTATTWNRH